MLFKVSTTTTRIVIKRTRVVDEVRPGRLVYPEAVHHSIIKQSMVLAPGGVEEALVITVATGV